MRLIVTRPEPAASRTAEKLRALAHDVLVSPVLEIIDTQLDMPTGPFSASIITSSNALRIIEQRCIAEKLTHKPIYVVGDKTAGKARELGFTEIYSASGNAQNLITLLDTHSDYISRQQEPVLYICGEDATPGFAKGLRNIGLQVSIWANYKANLVDQLTYKSVELLNSGKPVGILLYSARSAQQFSKLSTSAIPNQDIDNIQLYALSNNVKQGLSKDLQNRCHVAQNPDETSLFNLIQV